MRVLAADSADAQARLSHSTSALLEVDPELSSARLLTSRQRDFFIWLLISIAAGLVLAPLGTMIVLVTIATVFYVATITQRVVITVRSRRGQSVVVVSDEDARAVADADLPVYTVLIPAYREAGVLPSLIAHVQALEYPRDRLDVKLLLEEDDHDTIESALALDLDLIELVLVPPSEPRTKPKALNYGLTFARGELVTIYDAEDDPEPLQLRRAAVAFSRLPQDVACLQAELTYHNADQNVITRWFTVEYLMWFRYFLPGLSATDAPVPLGGTSNHMRRSVLEGIGAWDAHNVTEDADLGVRLHRQGWRTGVLGSWTFEEGNSDFVNWMKQRSRWYKGYLQTWLVHLRHPVRLWHELGTAGFLQFNLFVGGTPLLAVLNPVFWLLTILWFLGHVKFVQDVYPTPVYFLGLFCFVFGNFLIYYVTILAARTSGRPSLVLAACVVPVYWVMMSIAAVKAFWQLVVAPSYWEKTTHGLSNEAPDPSKPAALASPELAPVIPLRSASRSRTAEPFQLPAADRRGPTAERAATSALARADRLARLGRNLRVAGLGAVVVLGVLVASGVVR